MVEKDKHKMMSILKSHKRVKDQIKELRDTGKFELLRDDELLEVLKNEIQVDFDNKEDNHVKGVHDKLLIEFTDLLNGSYKGD